jgi:hypothetical protein
MWKIGTRKRCEFAGENGKSTLQESLKLMRKRGVLGARFLARKGADSHCRDDKEKEGMDRCRA